MSDELRKLAEAAIPHPFKGVDDNAKRMLAAYADAETILALLDERDRLRERAETQVMGALSDWNLAAEKMKADIKAAHASGIREGLERAAKVADPRALSNK